jgi:hypothetical protein
MARGSREPEQGRGIDSGTEPIRDAMGSSASGEAGYQGKELRMPSILAAPTLPRPLECRLFLGGGGGSIDIAISFTRRRKSRWEGRFDRGSIVFDRICFQSRANRGIAAYAAAADQARPGRGGHCSGCGRALKRGLSPSSGVKPWFGAARSRGVLSRRGVGPLRGRHRGPPAIVPPPALRPS